MVLFQIFKTLTEENKEIAESFMYVCVFDFQSFFFFHYLSMQTLGATALWMDAIQQISYLLTITVCSVVFICLFFHRFYTLELEFYSFTFVSLILLELVLEFGMKNSFFFFFADVCVPIDCDLRHPTAQIAGSSALSCTSTLDGASSSLCLLRFYFLCFLPH
jgi:hypothetical protein